MLLLQQHGFKITYITGWRAYLGSAQHNYPHWTKVDLPEGHHDLATLERIPGVLPFEVYAQAPLRLISWCSFELDNRSKALLREPAILCKSPTTSTEQLVAKKAQRQANVCIEQDAIQYLATLATVQIASRAQMPNYTTMVQHFFRDIATANGNLHAGLLPADAQSE
jgi:CelD/BcsL family acetyltransferase involved in cellulose biosynthesis